MSYLATVLADTPVALYPLDEASGTSATDATGNGHTGTTTGASPGGSAGLPGDPGSTAYLFHGGSDLVDLTGMMSGFPTGNSPWTIEAWVRPTSVAANATVLSIGTSGTDLVELVFIDPTNIQTASVSNGGLNAGVSSMTGGLHHIAATWDGTTWTLYWDGAVANSSTPGPFALTTGAGGIGTDAFHASPDGGVAWVGIYTSALSAARIAIHYGAGLRVRVFPSPVATPAPYIRTQLFTLPVVTLRGGPAQNTPIPISLDIPAGTIPEYRGPFGRLNGPQGLSYASEPNLLYIADGANNRVCVVDLTAQTLRTLNVRGFGGGQSLGYCQGVYWDDPASTLYIVDGDHNVVWACDGDGGHIAIFAGTYNVFSFSGAGGAATSAAFGYASAIWVDSGVVYITDSTAHVVCAVSAGILTIFAGTMNTSGFSGDTGAATSATLFAPKGITSDGSGTIFIADSGNHCIRRVASGTITTVAGQGTVSGNTGDAGLATSATLNGPTGLAWNGGSSAPLIICDTQNHRVRISEIGGDIFPAVGAGPVDVFLGGPANGIAYPVTGIALDLPIFYLLTSRFAYIADDNYIALEDTQDGQQATIAYAGDRFAGQAGDGDYRAFGALLESVTASPLTDNSGLLVVGLPAPADLNPTGRTYTVTLPSGRRTTDTFTYQVGSRLLSTLFLTSALPPTVVMTLDLFSLLGTAGSTAEVTVFLDQDSNIAGFPGRLWSDAPPEPESPDSSGIVAFALVKTSILDAGRLYGFQINGGAPVYFIAPDAGGRMNDVSNLRSFAPAGSIAGEVNILDDTPQILHHTSVTSLFDRLEEMQYRTWLASWGAPRPPMTYSGLHLYF